MSTSLLASEVGYLPPDDLGATVFFQLVSARCERWSIILTSSKSYGVWGSIFGDSIIATAILDRLLHHSTTINIRGESTGRRIVARPAWCRLEDAGLHSVRRQGSPIMKLRGGEFSTGTTGNFQPELTEQVPKEIELDRIVNAQTSGPGCKANGCNLELPAGKETE